MLNAHYRHISNIHRYLTSTFWQVTQYFEKEKQKVPQYTNQEKKQQTTKQHNPIYTNIQLASISSDCFPDSITAFFFTFLIFLSYLFYLSWASIFLSSASLFLLSSYLLRNNLFWSILILLTQSSTGSSHLKSSLQSIISHRLSIFKSQIHPPLMRYSPIFFVFRCCNPLSRCRISRYSGF